MTGSLSPSLDQSSCVRPLPSDQRRRKKVSAVGSDGKPLLRRKSSLSEDIGRCAAETYLITRLSFTLLQYLGLQHALK